MLSLNSINLFNFRSFTGEHRILIPDNGLVLIQGQAAPSESTSGVGKSSLLSSIPFALGFSSIPSTKLQSWFNDSPFFVELEMEINNQQIYLVRGQGRLEMDIEGVEVKGGKSVIEAKLKELLKSLQKFLRL